MNGPDDDLRQQIALFRYTLIADLAHLPVGTPGTGAMMRAKAEKTYTIDDATDGPILVLHDTTEFT